VILICQWLAFFNNWRCGIPAYVCNDMLWRYSPAGIGRSKFAASLVTRSQQQQQQQLNDEL